MGKPRLNLVGRRFGKLNVIARIEPPIGKTRFVCDCDCGNKTVATGIDIKSGNTTSCGCVKKVIGYTSNLKHGGASGKFTGAYRAWRSMKQRCLDKNCKAYADYGAKGVTVCQQWIDSFESFLSDMGERPNGYSLERINVFDGYHPANCKWIPLKEQTKNQRKTVRYTVNGTIMIQSDAARYLGIHPSSLSEMRQKGRLPNNVGLLA